MKLQKIVIIRHGSSDHAGFLYPDALESMKRLGALLKHEGFIDGETAFVCSDQLRTIKTAQALMRGAGIELDEECHDELFSSDRQCNPVVAMNVLRKYFDKTKTLVVVSHSELVDELPNYFFEQVFGSQNPREYGNFRHGEGARINCQSKEIELIFHYLYALPSTH